jgi:hypothetical protein
MRLSIGKIINYANERKFNSYTFNLIHFLSLGLEFRTNIDEKLFSLIGQGRPYATVSHRPIGFGLFSLLLTVTLLEIYEMF